MTPKINHASLEIELDEKKKIVSALASSLALEALKGRRLSFTVSTKNSGETLLFFFSAADLVSLRAGMNTILRLTSSALMSIRGAGSLDTKSGNAIYRKTE